MKEECIPLEVILQEIRDVYLASRRDWIVAYSGGKESPATLQLIWYALTALPPEHMKHLYLLNERLVLGAAEVQDVLTILEEAKGSLRSAQSNPSGCKSLTYVVAVTLTSLQERGVPVSQELVRSTLIGAGYPQHHSQ